MTVRAEPTCAGIVGCRPCGRAVGAKGDMCESCCRALHAAVHQHKARAAESRRRAFDPVAVARQAGSWRSAVAAPLAIVLAIVAVIVMSEALALVAVAVSLLGLKGGEHV